MLRTTLLVWIVVAAAACGGSNPGEPGGDTDAGTQDSGAPGGEPDAGGLADAGSDAGTQDGGVADAGSDAGTQDGGVADAGSDAGTQPLPPDPNDPNNTSKDTDCDGLSDRLEFDTEREGGQKTHPGVADTDGDGLLDGLELSISTPVPGTPCVLPPDADPVLKTSPVRADTDGDGLSDGLEDANKNGQVNEGETHPLLKDTDCDGLLDGPSTASTQGEDENANGTQETTESHPLEFDTDGDGLSDGMEQGVTVNLDPANCTGIFLPDEDPSTTTDPTNPDSDGDGVGDGTEDSNQNGEVDPGELDPQVPDVTGPAAQVCPGNQLRSVSFHSREAPDLQLALPPSFTEVTPILLNNEVTGLVGYDHTSKVAFLAFRRAAPAGATDPLGDEEALRPAIASQGALRNRTAQLFTTWEGFPAAEIFYEQSGASTDLKRRTDALVETLVPGSTGRLSGTASGVNGDFRLQLLVVHRSNQSMVVLIALIPLEATVPNGGTRAAFTARDLSEGSPLAQFGEPTRVQCERFQPPSSAKVDLLFVVDDSGSMATSQLSLALVAQSAVDALNAASLDWRMALVTSNYHFGTQPNTGKLRRFTRNVNKVNAWLTQNSTCGTDNVCSLVPTSPERATCPGGTSEGANGGCWTGINGSGSEGVLGAARKAIDDMTPGSSPGTEVGHLARQDATLVVVLLGDADDQTSGYTTTAVNCGTGGTPDSAGTGCEWVQNFVNFFGNRASPSVVPTNKTAKLITVHGIVCPSGSFCGCTGPGACDGTNASREFNPQPVNGVSRLRHATVVNASGGVLGSIIDTHTIGASMKAIIDDVIAHAGYKTRRRPIGASLKVALDNVRDPAACTAHDIPRGTLNGFNFDGQAGTLAFYGACSPASATSQAAVSFRYWVDTQRHPDGAAPCEGDPNYTPSEPDHCVGPMLGCNTAGDQCVCKPNCGGTCGAGTQCDMSVCSCEPIID